MNDRPPEPDNDSDTRDLTVLGPIGSAYIDFARERFGYRAPGGRVVGVESRQGLFMLDRRRKPRSPVPTRSTGARRRERRDSTRRSSSRDSPPGDPDEPEPGETQAPGEIIETRLAELGLSYREVSALTKGIVDPSTLSRIITGKVRQPYARTRSALAWALKVPVTEIWPVRRRDG